jgi:hypothetical protein
MWKNVEKCRKMSVAAIINQSRCEEEQKRHRGASPQDCKQKNKQRNRAQQARQANNSGHVRSCRCLAHHGLVVRREESAQRHLTIRGSNLTSATSATTTDSRHANRRLAREHRVKDGGAPRLPRFEHHSNGFAEGCACRLHEAVVRVGRPK